MHEYKKEKREIKRNRKLNEYKNGIRKTKKELNMKKIGKTINNLQKV